MVYEACFKSTVLKASRFTQVDFQHICIQCCYIQMPLTSNSPSLAKTSLYKQLLCPSILLSVIFDSSSKAELTPCPVHFYCRKLPGCSFLYALVMNRRRSQSRCSCRCHGGALLAKALAPGLPFRQFHQPHSATWVRPSPPRVPPQEQVCSPTCPGSLAAQPTALLP